MSCSTLHCSACRRVLWSAGRESREQDAAFLLLSLGTRVVLWALGRAWGNDPSLSGSRASKLMAQQLQWEKGVVIVPNSTVCQVETRSLASGQGQAIHHPALKHFLTFLIQVGVGPGAYQKASPVCHCLQLTPAISRSFTVVMRTG